MAIFNSGNPILSEKTFQNLQYTDASNAMTVKGTINKFGFMTIMLLASAFFSWKAFYDAAPYAQTLLWVGLLGGFAIAITLAFKKEWSPVLAPVYGLMEGLFVGSISGIYDYYFGDKMPNIVFNAIFLTLGVCAAMFFLYKYRIIKVTEKFKSVIIAATLGIAIFYLIDLLLLFVFKVDLPFMQFGDSSLLGIGISIFIVIIASLRLLLNFDMIEQGAAQSAPKYMEWYGAFGLTVTVVWLYLEILRLLSRFAGRD